MGKSNQLREISNTAKIVSLALRLNLSSKKPNKKIIVEKKTNIFNDLIFLKKK